MRTVNNTVELFALPFKDDRFYFFVYGQPENQTYLNPLNLSLISELVKQEKYEYIEYLIPRLNMNVINKFNNITGCINFPPRSRYSSCLKIKDFYQIVSLYLLKIYQFDFSGKI